MPPNAGAVLVAAFMNVVGKQLLSSQEKRADDKLKQASDLVTSEFRTLATKDDLRVVEDKFTFAQEMKSELDAKSGFQKYLRSRDYYKVTNGVYEHVKFVSDRTCGRTQFQSPPSTSSEAGSENIYRTARSLYQCFLSCRDPFPSPLTQERWVVEAWNQAYLRTGAHPNSLVRLRQDEEIKCDSMKLLADIKTEIKHAVDSLYEFDTSRAPEMIHRNATRAQALLAKTTFVYRDSNFGEARCPCYPYRHPIIQKIINITWFKNQDDIGVVFHEFFNPIPFRIIALAATVIECCIDEWCTGTFNETSWDEARYKIKYLSHLNSLRDLNSHGPDKEGKDLIEQIQADLLRAARVHAGAPPDPDPPAGSGRFSVYALDAAIHEDPPEYTAQ